MNKKLFLGMFAAVGMLFATSCQKEELGAVSSGDVATVSFTLGVEGGVQTRAISDGTSADYLEYAVFDTEGNRITGIDKVKKNVGGFPVTETITLAKGQTYKVVFWAQSKDCNAYTIDDNMNLTIDYAGDNNDENRDAFFACTEELNVTGSAEVEVVLKRPFAQLNVGVTEKDWTAAVNSGVTVANSKVELSKVATGMNLFNGTVSGETDVEYALAAIPAQKLTVNNTEYYYLSMSYILANAAPTGTEKAILESVKFTFDSDKNDIVFEDGLNAVPVQRNWRTNILGQILTGDINFEISIDPIYEGDYNDVETANCYIVTKAGEYSFQATRKGNERAASIEKSSIASAEVLWETYGTDAAVSKGDLISEVAYKDGYVYYTATEKKGNALIAVKDAGGNILWSWHIWLTDRPEDQVYANGAGIMMDRNLGATAAVPGKVESLGLYYQWGRKDPFLGASSIEQPSVVAPVQAVSTLNDWPVVACAAESGTVEYAVAHPTSFITGNEGSDWLVTANNRLWSSTKSIYDPCPAGYRVATSSVFKTASGYYYNNDSYDGYYDSTNRGRDFGEAAKAAGAVYMVESGVCWYPATAQRSSGSGNFSQYYGDDAYVWSCGATANGSVLVGTAMGFYDGSPVYFDTANSRAAGVSVRCQKIE